jgi:hypothetical protein
VLPESFVSRLNLTSAFFASHLAMFVILAGDAAYTGFLVRLEWKLAPLLVPMHAVVIGTVLLLVCHRPLSQVRSSKLLFLTVTGWVINCLNALAFLLGIDVSSGEFWWMNPGKNLLFDCVLLIVILFLDFVYLLLVLSVYSLHRAEIRMVGNDSDSD